MEKRLKLIACNVFFREISLLAHASPLVLDVEFNELGEHVHVDALRARLQESIDRAAASGRYDAVALAYGLCGRAVDGLTAPENVRLVLPRAHDCCTILLGSRERFKQRFGANPSTAFSSIGYIDRGDYFYTRDGELSIGDSLAALVERYGEEDAQYIWETMHPPGLDDAPPETVFIDIPEVRDPAKMAECRTRVEEAGGVFAVEPGSLELLRKLVFGEWDDDFLIVPPGGKIRPAYDWDEVVKLT